MSPGSLRSRKLLGVVVCVWLVGALTSAGLTWYVASTQEQRNAQFTRQDDQTIYVINRSSCAAYSLVDPTIKANNTLITALQHSIADPKTNAEMLKVNKRRLRAVEKQNIAFQSFRAIYGTIPLDFDCHRLPETPPS